MANSDVLSTRAEDHTYLSTACLHNKHGYCAAMTGCQGEKRPATCKFCDAQCVCQCHDTTEPAGGQLHDRP